MPSSTRVNFVTDPATKRQAMRILKKLGLDLSTGLNLFLHQVVECKGIPFSVDLKAPKETIVFDADRDNDSKGISTEDMLQVLEEENG